LINNISKIPYRGKKFHSFLGMVVVVFALLSGQTVAPMRVP